MAAHRRRDIVKSRRRVEADEGEEGGSETGPVEDDSLSEATAPSDLEDEDADAYGSDISEHDDGEAKASRPKDGPVNGSAAAATATAEVNGQSAKPTVADSQQTTSTPELGRGDTDAMLNGLKVPARQDDAEEMDFENMKESAAGTGVESIAVEPEKPSTAPRPDLTQERRRPTSEQYRQKRDADPTFVPNRGGFFMHDHRHPGPSANGFRPLGRGRGRDRGVEGGPFPGTR